MDSNKDFTQNPITDQGTKTIMVKFRDKLTGAYVYDKKVTRAFLAKMYHDRAVTHALNGVPVIDIQLTLKIAT